MSSLVGLTKSLIKIRIDGCIDSVYALAELDRLHEELQKKAFAIQTPDVNKRPLDIFLCAAVVFLVTRSVRHRH